MNIPSLTIDGVREGFLSRRFSAEELATEALRFAEAENPKTNAYLTFSPERALDAARAVDRKIAAGRRSRARSRACRSPSRTSSSRAGCGPPAARSCWRIYIPPYDATAVDPPGASRRRDPRQDQLRRVRHGIVE